jgi:uncharacterized protein YfiM (DUF2279 family)
MLPIVLAFSFSLHGPPASNDGWVSPDKVKHFFGGVFVQSLAYGGLRATGADHRASLIGASATTLVVSVSKEVWDGRGSGTPSARDLVWDAAGAATASVLLSQTVR